MDEALYNNILAALEAVHGGHTANEARQAAGQMLEGFKDRADGMPYALYILQTPSPRHTDQVRHFALHSLEHMLKVRWFPENDAAKPKGTPGKTAAVGVGAPPGMAPQLTLAEKEQLKEAMLQVMARGTRDVAGEAQFIKIKVADLVARLAERDYPNRWEGFLEQMMQAWTTGPIQAELAMMVLAILIEDCHDVDFRSEIDFSRRDPILRGLNDFLPQLMPTLYNFLVQQWMGYKAAVAAAGGASAGVGATEAALMNRALNLLSKIMPWAGEKSMGEEPNDFLPAIAQLSTLRVARSESLVCLEAMCSQKLSEKHFHRLLEHLPEMVQHVKQALAQEALPLSESLEVHQMLSACLEETMMRNINYIAGEKDFQNRNSRKSELLSKFLEEVLQLTKMPSKRMAGNLIQAWQTLANKPNAKDMPAFVVMVPQLVAAFASHIVTRRQCHECTSSSVGQFPLKVMRTHRSEVRFEDDVTDDPVAAEEFVDEEDYFQFVSGFRTQVKLLQNSVGKVNPLHIVTYILEQAQQLVQQHGTGRDHLDAAGFPTWKTEACRSWSTFASLARGTIVGLPSWCTGEKPENPEEMVEGGTTAFVSAQCFQMLRTVAELMITWQPNGSILIGHQLTVLESCKLLFVHESGMLQSVFDKLFTLLEQPDPNFNLAAMPGATVVTASPEVEAVRQAASRALVVLGTGVSAVLVVALGGICQRVNAVINNNRPSLAVRTHLLELLVVVSNSVKDENQRRGFVLDMLKEPMGVWVGEEVTNAVSSPDMRCIHMLWAPPTRQRLLSHPVARATLAIIPSVESEANRRRNKSGDYEVSPQDLRKLPLVAQWCRMLHDLRTVCYNLLGLSCRQGALYLAVPADKVQDVVVNGIFAGFEFIENRHLQGFCSRFVEKYVVCCPPSLVRSHVEPVMAMLASNIMPRLSAAWSPQSAGAQTLRARDPEKFQVYADGGTMLTEEDLDKDELEELKIKHRLHLTKGLADIVHACLALRGELNLPPSALDKGGAGGGAGDTQNGGRGRGGGRGHPRGQPYSARGGRGGRGGGNLSKKAAQAEKVLDGKRKRRRALLDVFVRGQGSIPPSLVMFTVGLIRHWGDAYSCRKALAIAHCILLEYDLRSDVMKQRLSRDLFSGVVDALVAGAPQLQGMEWEAVTLVKTLYVSFGLSGARNRTRGSTSDDSLRKKLQSLAGVLEQDVSTMDAKLRSESSDTRTQKEAVRDVLRRATLVAQNSAGRGGGKGSNASATFWKDNKGRSGGAKGQPNKSSNRNRNKKNGNNDQDNDNPSSDILWQRR
ncbi:conserved unknown protein [Ectocarpus siliculosus]|uniref:Uncharacterized protein n=1 Tax=Ectocarpus siliculosus TaxID=2880 RepID=D8LQ44_ECTSI|nr:conserved unknown protein [Ectocarpus siliculosus]|eukprot:CBN77424.1 conserved unknown protein [Ectocarpus siliculosus]